MSSVSHVHSFMYGQMSLLVEMNHHYVFKAHQKVSYDLNKTGMSFTVFTVTAAHLHCH